LNPTASLRKVANRLIEAHEQQLLDSPTPRRWSRALRRAGEELEDRA
jgi:hypothetical protein